MVYLSLLDTPWGAFAYAVRDELLIGTFLPESKVKARQRLQARFPDGVWCESRSGKGRQRPRMPEFRDQVLRYFAGEPVEFTQEVDLSDSATFHQRVLMACRKVPFGETITYGQLATKIGHPGAARAVGQAMAANPIPLVIPCHRVVAANGRLGGFSSPSGANQKLRLLQLENPVYEPDGMGIHRTRMPAAAGAKRHAQSEAALFAAQV